MTNKEKVGLYHRLDLLWCTKCLKPLTPEDTWLPDDTRDGRFFCFDCAPDTAIRLKDRDVLLSLVQESNKERG